MSGAAFGLQGHALAGTCPCGSGLTYARCCGPLHGGAPAATPEALMRARFTAFARRMPGFLLDTWHRTTRPHAVNLDPRRSWTRLEVLAAEADHVHFRAHFTEGGRAGVLEERSRFARERGRWVYLDGEFPEE